LQQAGVQHGSPVLFCDEMRAGLLGRVARRWCERGHKLEQKVQMEYRWAYLLAGVDPVAGRVHWCWLADMKAATLAQVMRDATAAGLRTVVWDGAPAHTSNAVRATGIRAITLPPYSPELNPAERLFGEIRRWHEGVEYPTLEHKKDAIDRWLEAANRDPTWLRSLCGWDWVIESIRPYELICAP